MKHFTGQQLDQLEPNYLAQYGLYEAPFTSKLDDRFMFLDADRAQRLNMLHHLTQYSDLLLIITGNKGVGKTSILQRFVNLADDDWKICNINANALMDTEQLLRNVSVGFGLGGLPSHSPDMQQIFIENLSELKLSGVIPILVIDNAHELPVEVLEAVFNLADTELESHRLLRIIMFSDPQIDITLKSSSIYHLRDRITHSMELSPFTEEQTEQYIYHRLAVAGLSGNNPISRKLVRKIYRGSDGYPEQINKLAHIALRDGTNDVDSEALFSESNYQFPLRRYLISGSIAAIVIGVVLTLQDSINKVFEDSEKIVMNVPVNLPPVAEKKPDPVVTSPIPTPVAAPAAITKKPTTAQIQERIILVDQNSNSQHQATNVTDNDEFDTKVVNTASINDNIEKRPETNANATQTKASASTQPNADDNVKLKPIFPEITSIEPQPIIGSNKPQTVTINGSGFGERSFVTLSWSGKSKRLAGHQTKIVDEFQIEIRITTGINPDNWSMIVTHPKNGKSNRKTFKVVAAKIAPNIAVKKSIQDEKWILAQKSKLLTLQLLATDNTKDIIDFATKKKLKGQYAMYKSYRNGSEWYHLILGTYPTLTATHTAMTNIPKGIGIGKPWIRSVRDIQNEIKKAQAISAKPKPRLKPIQQAATLPSSVKEQSSWLWGQSPTNYTLQLLGTRTEKSIKNFVKKHKLKGKAIYFSVRQNGYDWYALVYGVYPNRDSALKASKALSSSLQKAKPWARSFASIHAELERR